ncbi:hypothetical protein FIBSPDRAFT_957221 [Athelia psychrophila]|uniref:USP domain-containing protein n=1 Tax=Athelia psychrophila TaxID=1759441 RepID=A0A166G2L9_9AGAM|nr:hypothetical protein FIBSPDRAFT_957221 [Fibularhizoctonia sp. CBS 109695]
MSLIARWTWRVRHLHQLFGRPSYLGASCGSDGGEAPDVPSSAATEITPACPTAPDTSTPASPLSANTWLPVAPARPKRCLQPLPPPQRPSRALLPPRRLHRLLNPRRKPRLNLGPPSSARAPPPPGLNYNSPPPPSLASPSPTPLPSRRPPPPLYGIRIPRGGSPPHKYELLALLTTGPASSSSAPSIRPRGLINTGNLCFASLFLRGFEDAGKAGGGGAAEGKGEDMERAENAEEIYDAMKERFDNTRGGHRQNAEEFLGFYLDTLAKMLSLASMLSPPAKDAEATKEDGEHEEEESPGGRWLARGRQADSDDDYAYAASPITRMFGGKFRSTLQQKGWSIIEGWRALRLDIQCEQIYTQTCAAMHLCAAFGVNDLTHRPKCNPAAAHPGHAPDPCAARDAFFVRYTGQRHGKLGQQATFGPELVISPGIMADARRSAGTARYELFGVLHHHDLSTSGAHHTLDVLHPNRDPPVAAPSHIRR